MKRALRIIIILGCFLGLASLLRIQAHKREDIIHTAALQDQTGKVVKKVTSHRPQDLQLTLTVKLPAGETVLTLADQDNVQFKTGEITDLQANENVTAQVDQQHQLTLKNDQEQAQKVDVIVPVKVTDPLLTTKIQLDLDVAESTEKFTLPAVTVVAEDTDQTVENATEESIKQPANDASKQPANDASKETVKTPAKGTTKTAKKQATQTSDKQTVKQPQSNSQKTGSQRESKSATTTSDSTQTAKDEDADDAEASTTASSNTKLLAPPAEILTGADLDIHRAQIQIESWSDDLAITGTLAGKDDVLVKELGAEGIKNGGYYTKNSYKDNYHVSYMQKNPGTAQGDGEKAYAVKLDHNTAPAKDDAIIVYYSNVGAYTQSTSDATPDKQMGAIVKISNIKYHESRIEKVAEEAFIDFSNNFYSGMVYGGIESFDIDVTFTNNDWTQALVFPGKLGDTEFQTYFTFGSLNGNEDGAHEWAGTRRKGLRGKLAPKAKIAVHRGGWYEGIGNGVTNKETYEGEKPIDWGDYLGSSDYELGAVAFPMIGKEQLFKVKSESGFTWQSFSSGYILPLEPAVPQKTVHRTDEIGVDNNNLDGVTINRDTEDIDHLYYTIYQPTYSIPNESVAKPNQITMTDQLPAGLAVKPADVKLFNTDGKAIDLEGEKKGTVTISETGYVTYNFSEEEIEALTFDGKPFAIQMKGTFADDFVGTFRNKAKVKFDSGDRHTWEKETNEVVTHLFRGSYEFQKVDSTTGKSLTGAEFIIQNADGQYLTFADGQLTGVVAEKDQATRLTGDDDGHFKVIGLKPGTYTLIETQAPDGFVIGQPTEFAITDQGQPTPEKIKNDPYSLPITGGQGIIWFVVVGLILTLTSFAIWHTRPRGG